MDICMWVSVSVSVSVCAVRVRIPPVSKMAAIVSANS